MPCPLRFVLAGVSAAVALWLFCFTVTQPGAEEHANSTAVGHANSSWRRWLRMLLDFFSGRYLYRTLSEKRQHVKTGQLHGIAPADQGEPLPKQHGGAAPALAQRGSSCPFSSSCAAAVAARTCPGSGAVHEE
ncbi:hypothetical protein D9Q98_009056 [Chlorella vulgaris]|uniref:Uncharacterized protein n=1 Tax=Chlorella vulgaris TaxID=3077 RepID=A0A9D4YTM8_CHLVU|nr:hypothetical protein D9Q98_009056 [Chlorella vulgaris]